MRPEGLPGSVGVNVKSRVRDLFYLLLLLLFINCFNAEKNNNFKLQTTKTKHEFSIESTDVLFSFYSSEIQLEKRSELLTVKV